MNNFYFKLALKNLKANNKFYIPYILSCIGTIMMFYIMIYIATSLALAHGQQATESFMVMGAIVIGFFSIIFFTYTNRFLMKRREKEFGLYNILGLDKNNLSIMMGVESFIVGLVSIILGILGGVIFSRLCLLVLENIIKIKAPFSSLISPLGISWTFGFFICLFASITIINCIKVRLTKPIELLHGTNAGEKEPKINWLKTIVGILSLGMGYTIALMANRIGAIEAFLVAVILVIIGTNLLFSSCSIALLKILRNNKNYFYKINNFFGVSNMIYRMRQNAKGLSNICILSTMVIVMAAGTSSLYFGVEDCIRARYPHEIEVHFRASSLESYADFETDFITLIEQEGAKNIKTNLYVDESYFYNKENDTIFTLDNESASMLGIFHIHDVDSYNLEFNTDYDLEEDEAILITTTSYVGNTITTNNKTFKLKLVKDNTHTDLDNIYLFDSYHLIVSSFEQVKEIIHEIPNTNDQINFYLHSDISGTRDAILAVTAKTSVLADTYRNHPTHPLSIINMEGRESNRDSFNEVYGGFLFLGILLSFVFIMGMACIMYYKQVVEGYDDIKNYDILYKVGLSKEESKKIINSQVLKIFFIPLLVAIIHYCFAFKIITHLLFFLNLTNVTIFLQCSVVVIAVFSVIYIIMYLLTAKVYYKIISNN